MRFHRMPPSFLYFVLRTEQRADFRDIPAVLQSANCICEPADRFFRQNALRLMVERLDLFLHIRHIAWMPARAIRLSLILRPILEFDNHPLVWIAAFLKALIV